MTGFRIVGYTYAAENYHPGCVIAALPTGEGGAFDGWALAEGVRMTVEDNLDEIAAAFGFDRNDEGTFDSGDFPKRIYSEQVEYAELCGGCHTELIPTLGPRRRGVLVECRYADGTLTTTNFVGTFPEAREHYLGKILEVGLDRSPQVCTSVRWICVDHGDECDSHADCYEERTGLPYDYED